MSTDAITGRHGISVGRKSAVYWAVFSALSLVAFISFWIFSRFTVDDAFITWRYGENLVNSGVWGYNPVSFDLTQAYTNPIYAALSIIPHYLGVDVVLFFKIFSLSVLSVFGFWFSRRTGLGIFVVLLYAVPATFIHAFSGLETFLYVCLLTAFFVFLIKDDFWGVISCALLLFVTRPESWVLIGLVPFFHLLPEKIDGDVLSKGGKSICRDFLNFRKYGFKRATLSFLLLSVPMVAYFVSHKVYFGHALPNTFYIKSGGSFSLQNFFYFSFVAIPFIGILVAGKIRAFLVVLLFFGAVIVSYSTSSLAMNYIDRFAFHIAVPAYLILVYVAANHLNVNLYISKDVTFKSFYVLEYKNLALLIAVVWISIFGVKNLSALGLVQVANYYPRALDSHAELGKAIREDSLIHDIDAMSFGDAGMTAYHSGIISLDNIGLGSAMVAHEGVNNNTLDSYSPGIVVFHARPAGIRLGDHNQNKIHEWAEANGHKHVCQAYFKPKYTLNIYSSYDLVNVEEVCESSEKVNNIGGEEYYLKHGGEAPWEFWRS